MSEFANVDLTTHLHTLFSEMRPAGGQIDPRNASILIFKYDIENYEEQLEVLAFDSVNAAVNEYGRLEKELSGSADIVLVGSRSPESIKSAYRNYFSDASEFVAMLEQSLEILSERAG